MAGGNTIDVASRVEAASKLPLERLRELARRNAALRKEERAPAIPALPRDGRDFPLSFAQERMWFLHQLAPQSPAYNVSTVACCRSRAEVARFATNLNVAVARHEVLRSVFPSVDAHPVQRVQPSLRVQIPCVDLTAVAPHRQNPAALRLVQREALRPFDLARGPLVRAAVVTLSPDKHVVVSAFHHIAVDGTSMYVLLREMETPVPLPPLRVQYADYAEYERERLQGEHLDKLVGYWIAQLAGVQPLDLPTDYARAEAAGSSPAVYRSITCEPATVAQIGALSRAENATPFMTWLACFAVLLHRMSGRSDFSIGAPVTTRLHADVQHVAGCFINNLVLRVDLSGALTFRQLLQRVRATCTDAYAHQELPYDKLVEVLRPARRAEQNPLFQAQFECNYTPFPYTEPGALTLSGPGTLVRQGTAMFDVSLSVDHYQSGDRERWVCSLETNGDLYSADTTEDLLRRFQLTAGTLAASPDVPLSDLTLLTAEELSACREPPSADVPPANLRTLLEASVASVPDAIALQRGDDHLTYRGLDCRANRLAHHLIAAGAGPECRIAICLDRSVDYIVALAGALKASSAFIPLDPDHPQARLRHIVDSTGTAIVVTTSSFASVFDSARARVVSLDLDAPAIRASSALPPPPLAGPANLAYVIYTSGSSGVPKGVGVPIAAIAYYVQEVARRYGMTRADRVLQFSSLGFDASLEEILVPLLAGARLVLRSDAMLDAAELLRACDALGITVLSLPTAFWHGLASQARRAGVALPSCVRLYGVGGERMDPASAADWASRSRGRLLNLYGPTETTIGATMFEVPRARGRRLPSEVPIGAPFGRNRALILDDRLQPAPPGHLGELYLGGPGVARGYEGRPDLTAERFVPDGFSAAPGRRLYRTGDLARQRPSGDVVFHGRTDRQVKLRGFRVELQELETVLLRHPAVQQAAAGIEQKTDAQARLVAWLVAVPGTTRGAVQEFLASRLPDFMVPGVFVFLDRLPLTSAGKVDRAALWVPDTVAVDRGSTARARPRTDLERTIARIWSEEIAIGDIGIYDNFFDIGGHSLLAANVRARLAATLNRTIDLVDLFHHPTIAALAAHLGGETALQPDRASAETRAVGRHAMARRQRELRTAPR